MKIEPMPISEAPVAWTEILLVEDDSSRAKQRRELGASSSNGDKYVTVRLHSINPLGTKILGEKRYCLGALKRSPNGGSKATVALRLIDAVQLRRNGTVVTAGSAYGSNKSFITGLEERGLDFVLEVRPSTLLRRPGDGAEAGRGTAAKDLLTNPKWKKYELSVPNAASPVLYLAAPLAYILLPSVRKGRFFAAQTGGIQGVHHGSIFGIASDCDAELKDLIRVVGWARWIRPANRIVERSIFTLPSSGRRAKTNAGPKLNSVPLTIRANISIARRQDIRAATRQSQALVPTDHLRGVLTSISSVLNVAELFAGAGGMGLGFLLARRGSQRYRLVFSGEVNPIYVETLKKNQDALSANSKMNYTEWVPEYTKPVDLRTAESAALLRTFARQTGGVHILIAGPPCQGFSSANRNSWHRKNPHNFLIDVLLKHIETLCPPVFLLENVQGILWTPSHARSAQFTVVEHISRRMVAAGYQVFPKLLDAVWYGVPQYRSRFFLLGLRNDLGYRREDFGEWGPFPLPTNGPGCDRPHVTVRQAIGDLPPVANGEDAPEREYKEPSPSEIEANQFLGFMRMGAQPDVIFDHVTSRHADYVIERYRHIPRGGNWQDIADMLTNYAEVNRTHSNIYRRLKWSEPAITIGHYRKTMMIHPSQHRGLSLREATRLQSFPDWFRFSGGSNYAKTGLAHKQQQLANALCPLVAKALAEFILQL